MVDTPARWTTAEIADAVHAARLALDAERRTQFEAFDIPNSCLWPASLLYHRHSFMGPAWTTDMTVEEVETFTRTLDYKRYPDAERVALPTTEPLPMTLEAALVQRRSERSFSEQSLELEELAKLVELGDGVIDRTDIPRRRAPSPGGLYPVEIYPVAFAISDLTPAVYHYHPLDDCLELVRPISDREEAREFIPPDLFDARPPLILALTIVLPRVSTKYLERGYRFALLEAGHISQNLLLAATAMGLNALPMGGFWDEPFNEFLGLDQDREGVVYAILVGNATT